MVENLIVEPFVWTKNVKQIPYKEHGITGLGNVTYRNTSSAFDPSPMHYHSNFIEIYCILKGRRFSEIQANGEILNYTLQGNEALVTYPFEIHSNGIDPQAPCELFAFQIDVSDTSSILCLNKKYSQMLYHMLMTMPCRHVALKPELIGILRRAFSLFSELTPDSCFRGAQLLSGWLADFVDCEPLYGKTDRFLDAPIVAAINYLNQNITEPLQLAELAQASGYSLSRFKVLFKEAVGITPAEYITMKKIDVAKSRLVSGDETITDLAYSIGFSSSNYFCSVFKKMMGCSPKNYRMRFRNGS